jgi:HlyD family secretion protein
MPGRKFSTVFMGLAFTSKVFKSNCPVVLVAFHAALEKNATFKVTYMKDLGTYAAWKATKTTGQFDLKTFEVKAKPIKTVENLRPGMSAIIEK